MATIKDVAAALGCNSKAAASRLVALGYVETCGRCGGDGRYSFNLLDGDRCYGCGGSGKVLPRITRALVAEAKARQDAGELEQYFARLRAIAEAKGQIAPLVAEAEAVYKVIADAYTRACDAGRKAGGYAGEAIFRAQTLNNALFWGPKAGQEQRADELFSSDGVKDVEHRARRGREGAVSAVAKLRERIVELTALRDAAAPHLEAWIAAPKVRDLAA